MLSMNQAKTFVVLSTLTALLVWIGQALGGWAGLLAVLGMAAVMNLAAYWFADRLILRTYRAEEVSERESPRLVAIVHELASRANLPMPPEEAPNAFATGRDAKHGVVAVTQGLLGALDSRKVAAVIAHELGHIKNRDTLIMSLAAMLAGALSMIANASIWGSFMGTRSGDDDESSPASGLPGKMVAPVAASLVRMSISRAREFLADEAAANITGDPMALAGALRKIADWSHSTPMHSGSPARAHLFIHNPFTPGGVASLFSTHPPTKDRIERLERIHATESWAA